MLLLDKCQFMPNFIKHIEKVLLWGAKIVGLNGRDWGGAFAVVSCHLWRNFVLDVKFID